MVDGESPISILKSVCRKKFVYPGTIMYLFKFRNCWHICDECAGLLRSAEWSVTCNCPNPPPPPSLCRYSYYHCSSQLRYQINYPVVTHNHPHLLQLLLNKYVLLCYWERWKKSDHAIPWLCLWYKLTTVLLTCVGVPSPSPPCHHMSLAASTHRCGPAPSTRPPRVRAAPGPRVLCWHHLMEK